MCEIIEKMPNVNVLASPKHQNLLRRPTMVADIFINVMSPFKKT